MARQIGYSRTSTTDQIAGLEAQIRDLRAAGCTVIYSEQVSSVAEREQLNRALADVGPGDTLVVCKPDRLARSTLSLLEIVRDLDTRGSNLTVLSMGGQRLDTASPTSRLMLTILAGVATWEREIMLERQREGIAKAKSEGKYHGRKTTADGIIDSVKEFDAAGVTQAEIARRCQVSIRTVGRIRKASKPNDNGHILQPSAARAHDSTAYL